MPALFAGLAQHHGVKTRLIDFTFNPLKAAYFATTNHDGSADICVWGLSSEIFKDENIISARNILPHNPAILSIYAMMLMPNNVNDYLYRQEGLFLYPKFPHEFCIVEGRYPSVLDYIQYRFSDQQFAFPFFYKMVLKGEQVRHLVMMLRKEGISLATLMPTFDNVRQEMYDDLRVY